MQVGRQTEKISQDTQRRSESIPRIRKHAQDPLLLFFRDSGKKCARRTSEAFQDVVDRSLIDSLRTSSSWFQDGNQLAAAENSGSSRMLRQAAVQELSLLEEQDDKPVRLRPSLARWTIHNVGGCRWRLQWRMTA